MTNQDLINYINQARAEGTSDQKIKEDLLKAGWAQIDIDEAFAIKPNAVSSTPNFNTGISQKTSIAKTAIIAVFAVLLISGTAGAFYYADKQFNWGILVPKKVTENASSTLTTPTSTPKTITDETINWQTYKNDEYGFELKYPNDLKEGQRIKVEGDTVIVSLIANENVDEGTAEPLRYSIFIDTADKLPSFAGVNLNFVEQKIGQYTVYKTTNIPSRSGILSYFIKNQSKYFEISLNPFDLQKPFPQQEKYLNIFSKILSTFKFTAQ